MNRALSLFAVALGIVVGCSSGPSENVDATGSRVSGVPIGDVRGVADISKSLRTRLFDPADPRTSQFDVARVAGPVFKLKKQLGTFASEGTTTTYQGGEPTPLRATLWHQLAGRFADGIADLCANPGTKVTFVVYEPDLSGGPPGSSGGVPGIPLDGGATVDQGVFRLQESVAQRIAAVCAFDGDEVQRKQVASSLFDTVMGIGGSLAPEKASFERRFAVDGASSVTASAKQRVTSMMLALLLSPHFLLAK
jgi:hypothetical protein